MNAVEIEEAVSALVAEPFKRDEFPYQFLAAFGFKETTLKKLKTGASNTSDVPDAVLLRNNIHLVVAAQGKTTERLVALKASQKTAKGKVKFVLATDGEMVEAEELVTGEPLACPYTDLANHFGFFLPLAGISTVAEIKENPIDIKATGRLNKLYIQLLKDNEDWASDAKRPQLNQFLARLIFCFFAEDTGIFLPGLFTNCLRQMTDQQSTNTHEVIQKLFQAMDTPIAKRKEAKYPAWADQFPYVNGKLFSGTAEVPKFSKIAHSYLLRVGELHWQDINPDIFGSMIQAVADDDERGSLGMHYTSVPNILKVLDPLFLDDLREQLEEAADNPRKLLNLRKRLAAIRVFDPACGSGNFLVIAYIKMREIEAEIIKRRKDEDKKSWIKLTNFYGIEIKSFPAEIARLALLIAEFQCNVRHIGQREACLDVLPLHDTGKIVTGNALRLNWTEVCPPPKAVSAVEEDLAGPTGKLAFDSEVAAETYICGNPPYLGGKSQSKAQKEDLGKAFGAASKIGELDYVCGWVIKSAQLVTEFNAKAAFVATSSINQGSQAHQLWGKVFSLSTEISFAHLPFKWSNNAKANAAVICVIIGLGRRGSVKKRLFDDGFERQVSLIGPYLIPGSDVIVEQSLHPLCALPPILTGNSPYDSGHLILSTEERENLLRENPEALPLIRRLYGSFDFLNGHERFCLWISEQTLAIAQRIEQIAARITNVADARRNGGEVARGLATVPYRFRYTHTAQRWAIIVPRVSSERRTYVPFGLLDASCIISDSAQAIYDPEYWVLSVLSSKVHMSWIKAVSGRLKSDIRYSSALCYNTFPIPSLTANDRANLTRCAEDILLAREAHFPATIADLYDPEHMPADLRAAHDRNDETLERIYIGRRFKNDTERLEKLFEMYTRIIKDEEATKAKAGAKNGRKSKNDKTAEEGDQA